MKGRYLATFISGILLLGIVVFIVAIMVARTPIQTDSTALRVGIGLVMAFLVLLIIRYFLLIWLGYLQHIEQQFSADDDTFTPPVTLIVPAYNEAMVIQSAIRSLLDLDYPAYEILVIDDGST